MSYKDQLRIQAEVGKMIRLAAKYHGDQLYGKRSYMFHLEEVTTMAKDILRKKLFGSEGLDKILLLQLTYGHDIFEDTDCTREEVEAINPLLPDKILRISKNEGPDYDHEIYLRHVKEDPYTRIAKISDTFVNLNNSFKAGAEKRIIKYTDQLKYLVS